MLYARDSLKVYASLREKAKALVVELKGRGITDVQLQGNDEMMDILRLTCIESGIEITEKPMGTVLRYKDQDYQVVQR